MANAPQTKERPLTQCRTIFLKDRRDLEYQARRAIAPSCPNNSTKLDPPSPSSNYPADVDNITFPLLPEYTGPDSIPQIMGSLAKIKDNLFLLVSGGARSTTLTKLHCFSRSSAAQFANSLFLNIRTALPTGSNSCLEMVYSLLTCMHYLLELELYVMTDTDLEILAAVLSSVVKTEHKYSNNNILVYEITIQLVANLLSTKALTNKQFNYIIFNFSPYVYEICSPIVQNAAPAAFVYHTNSFWFLSNTALFYTRKDTTLEDPTYQACLQLLPLVIDTFLCLYKISEPLWFDECQLRNMLETSEDSVQINEHTICTLNPGLELFYIRRQLSYLAWAMTFFCDAENTVAREHICRNIYRTSNIMGILLDAMYELPIYYAVGLIHILLKTLGSILNSLEQRELDAVLEGNLLYTFLTIVTTLFTEDLDTPHLSSIHVIAGIFWICSNLATTHSQIFLTSKLVPYFLLGIQSSIPLLCRNAFLALHNILYYLDPCDLGLFLDAHEENLWVTCANIVKCSCNLKWEHRNRVLSHCLYIFGSILAYDTSIYLDRLDELLDDFAELQNRDLLDDATNDDVSRLISMYR